MAQSLLRCRPVTLALAAVVVGAACAGTDGPVDGTAPSAASSSDSAAVSVTDPSGQQTPAWVLGEIVHPSTGPCGVDHDERSGRAWVSYANTRQIDEVDPVTGQTVASLSLEGTRPCLLQWIDGALWVGVFRDAVVQRLDPQTGEITAEVPLTGNAGALLHAFGHLWILDRSAPAVRKIDPASGDEVGSVPVDGSPRGLVATDDGVWLVRERPGVVTRIDPDELTIAEEIEVEPGIRGIVATPDALWVTRARVGTIHRIDLADRSVGEPVVVGEDPRGIVYAHGSIWVGDVTGALVRIDPASHQVIGRLPFAVGTGGAAPVGDQLWVFEPSRVVRVDPAAVAG